MIIKWDMSEKGFQDALARLKGNGILNENQVSNISAFHEGTKKPGSRKSIKKIVVSEKP